MSAYYQRHPGLRLTSVEDEGIVLQLDTRSYYSVNETGLLILEALRQPRSADQLVDALLERYVATPQYARECILQFLASCHGNQLVVRLDAA